MCWAADILTRFAPKLDALFLAFVAVQVCAWYRNEQSDAWYEFNLSRSRAKHKGTPPGDGCAVFWGYSDS